MRWFYPKGAHDSARTHTKQAGWSTLRTTINVEYNDNTNRCGTDLGFSRENDEGQYREQIEDEEQDLCVYDSLLIVA